MAISKRKKKVFIINRTDALGDTLLTLGMAKVLKCEIADLQVAFIHSHKVGNLFDVVSDVDFCHLYRPTDSFYQRVKGLWSFFKQLSVDHSLDGYVYVGGSHWVSFIAFLMRIPFRGGILSRWPSFLWLKSSDATRQKRSQTLMHESRYNFELLLNYLERKRPGQKFQFSQNDLAPHFDLAKQVSLEAKDELREQAMQQGKAPELCDHPLIMIHPGMTGHTLNWPLSFYAKLIQEKLQQDSQLTCILSMTPSDQEMIDQVIDFLAVKDRSRVIVFNGMKKGLVNYMGLLKMTSLFIGPSTGTTHLANLLGVPTIGLYSPIKAQSAKRWGPHLINDKTIVLTPETSAQEKTADAMAKIDVAMVLNAMDQLLKK